MLLHKSALSPSDSSCDMTRGSSRTWIPYHCACYYVGTRCGIAHCYRGARLFKQSCPLHRRARSYGQKTRRRPIGDFDQAGPGLCGSVSEAAPDALLVCGEKMLNYRRRQQDMVSRCLLMSPRRCRCLGLESWRRHSQPTSGSILPHSRRRGFRRRKRMMYKGRERREQRTGETTCLESEGKRKTVNGCNGSNTHRIRDPADSACSRWGACRI